MAQFSNGFLDEEDPRRLLSPREIQADLSADEPPASLESDTGFPKLPTQAPLTQKLPAIPDGLEPFNDTMAPGPERAASQDWLRQQGIDDNDVAGRQRLQSRYVEQQQRDAARESAAAERQAAQEAAAAQSAKENQYKNAGVVLTEGADGNKRPSTREDGSLIYEPAWTGTPRFDTGTKAWVRDRRDDRGNVSRVDMWDNGDISRDTETGDLYFQDGGVRTVVGKDQDFLRRKAIGQEIQTMSQADETRAMDLKERELQIQPLKDQYTEKKKVFEEISERLANLQRMGKANPNWLKNSEALMVKTTQEWEEAKKAYQPLRDQFDGYEAQKRSHEEASLANRRRKQALETERNAMEQARRRPEFSASAEMGADESEGQRADRQQNGIGGDAYQFPDLATEEADHRSRLETLEGAQRGAEVKRFLQRRDILRGTQEAETQLNNELLSSEARTQGMTAAFDRRFKALDRQLRSGSISQEDYNAQASAMEAQLTREGDYRAGLDSQRAEIRKKAFTALQESTPFPAEALTGTDLNPQAVDLRTAGRAAAFGTSQSEEHLDVLKDIQKSGAVQSVGGQPIAEAIRDAEEERDIRLEDVLTEDERRALDQGLTGSLTGTKREILRTPVLDGEISLAQPTPLSRPSLLDETQVVDHRPPYQKEIQTQRQDILNRDPKDFLPEGYATMSGEAKKKWLTEFQGKKMEELAAYDRSQIERGGDRAEYVMALRGEGNGEALQAQAQETWNRNPLEYWLGQAGRSFQNYQNFTASMAGLVMKLTGQDETARNLLLGADAGVRESALSNPRLVEGMENIRSVSDFGAWGIDTLIDLAPQMAESVASSVAGSIIGGATTGGPGAVPGFFAGLLGKTALKNLARRELVEEGVKVIGKAELEAVGKSIMAREGAEALIASEAKRIGSRYGQVLGGLASSYKGNAGEIYMNLANDPAIDGDRAAIAALLWSVPAAALDIAAEVGPVAKLLGTSEADARRVLVKGEAWKKRLLKEAKDAGFTIAGEGTTEGLQSINGWAAQRWAKHGFDATKWEPVTEEEWSELRNSIAAGAVGGGPFAATGMVSTLGRDYSLNRQVAAYSTLNQKYDELSEAARSPEALAAYNAKLKKPLSMAKVQDLLTQTATARNQAALTVLLNDEDQVKPVLQAVSPGVDMARMAETIRRRPAVVAETMALGKAVGPALGSPEWTSVRPSPLKNLAAGHALISRLEDVLKGGTISAELGRALESEGLLIQKPTESGGTRYVVTAPALSLMDGNLRRQVSAEPGKYAFAPEADTTQPGKATTELKREGDEILRGMTGQTAPVEPAPQTDAPAPETQPAPESTQPETVPVERAQGYSVTLESAPDEEGFTRRRTVQVQAASLEAAGEAAIAQAQTNKWRGNWTAKEITPDPAEAAAYPPSDETTTQANPGNPVGETGPSRTEGDGGVAEAEPVSPDRAGTEAGTGDEDAFRRIEPTGDGRPDDADGQPAAPTPNALAERVAQRWHERGHDTGLLRKALEKLGVVVKQTRATPSNTKPFANGVIELNLNPEEIVTDRVGAGEATTSEELWHVAGLVAKRKEWDAAGRPAPFNEWLMMDAKGIFADLMDRLGTLEGAERDAVEQALVSSFNLYFADFSVSAERVRNARDIGKILNSPAAQKPDAVLQAFSVVHEFARQLAQLREVDSITEETHVEFLRGFVRWMHEAVKALRSIILNLDAEGGMLDGTQIRELVDAMEREMVALNKMIADAGQSEMQQGLKEGAAPVMNWLAEQGGVKGKTKVENPGGEYDDAIPVTVLGGHAQKVYGGALTPDEAAQALYEAGLIGEPSPTAMWGAIEKEVKTLKGLSAKPRGSDNVQQLDWLNREATARGFQNIDDLAERNPDMYVDMVQTWRGHWPRFDETGELRHYEDSREIDTHLFGQNPSRLPAESGGGAGHPLDAAQNELQRVLRAGQASEGGKAEILQWARDAGRVVNKLPWRLDGPRDVGAGEHHVFFHNNRVVKVTKGSGRAFGRTLDLRGQRWSIGRADALQYLERLKLQNEVFGDDIVLHGVFADRHGNVNIITSQSAKRGEPVSREEMEAYFRTAGFQSIGDAGYYRAADNVLALDMHEENAVLNEGSLLVFDAITLHPTEEQLQRLREQGVEIPSGPELRARAGQGVFDFGLSGSLGSVEQPALDFETAEPVRPVENREVPPEERKTPPRNLEDFGEKLGNARKDRVPAFQTTLSDKDIAAQKFSDIWPKSAVDEIEDIPQAAFAHTLRASIQAKPRNAYKLSRWVSQAQTVMSLVRNAEKNFQGVTDLMKRGGSGLFNLWSKMTLLQAIPRSAWDRIGEVLYYPDAYDYAEDRTKIPAPYARAEVDGKPLRATSLDGLIEAVQKATATEQASQAKKMEFEVRGRPGAYSINKKGDPARRKLKTFSVDAPRSVFDYIRDNYDDLLKAWGDVKERDNVKERDLRREANKARQGKNHRNGRDVTPEMFQEAFRFRGVEFGNWVSDGKNHQQRQGMLNEAYDALLDLADILDVPAQALSLNGQLGLRFGSNGQGWASAHYEPGNIAINLTKTRGAGSLAHEFFHALDHYFQRFRGESISHGQGLYLTQNPGGYYRNEETGDILPTARFNELKARWMIRHAEKWIPSQGVRVEVEAGFEALVRALEASPMAKRSAKIDGSRSKPYWGTAIEMAARAFENYVIHKMALNGYSNDYLANVIGPEEFVRNPERYPYLREDEIAPIAEAFDNLFASIKNEPTEQGVRLYSRARTSPRNQVWMNFGVEGSQGDKYQLPLSLPEAMKDASGEEKRLFHENIGLAYSIAEGYQNVGELSDLRQEGLIALSRAAKSFDPKKGKFSTWAGTIIRNHFNSLYRQRDAVRSVSLEAELGDSGRTLEEVTDSETETPAVSAQRTEAVKAIQETIAGLPENLRILLTERMQGKTQEAIGAERGMSKQQISHLEKVAMGIMRARLKERGVTSIPLRARKRSISGQETFTALLDREMFPPMGGEGPARGPARTDAAEAEAIAGNVIRDAEGVADGIGKDPEKIEPAAKTTLRDHYNRHFRGRFDKLNYFSQGAGEALLRSIRTNAEFAAAMRQFQSSLEEKLKKAFGHPSFWRNRKQAERLKSFKSLILPYAAALNPVSRNGAGEFVFADFWQRSGEISGQSIEQMGKVPGEEWVDTKGERWRITDYVVPDPKKPDEGFYQLERFIPAQAQETIHADFHNKFPEGAFLLDDFIEPGMDAERMVSPQGVELPTFNRHSLYGFYGDTPAGLVEKLPGYTPDVVRAKSLAGVAAKILKLNWQSPGRDYKSGQARVSGQVRDLFEGFNIRAAQAHMETARRETAEDLLKAAMVAVPPTGVPSEYVRLDRDTLNPLIRAMREASKKGQTDMPEIMAEATDKLTQKDLQTLEYLFGDPSLFDPNQMIHREVLAELERGFVRLRLDNAFLDGVMSWIRGSVAGVLADFQTISINKLSNYIFHGLRTAERTAYAAYSALAGERKEATRAIREAQYLVQGFFTNFYNQGIRERINRMVPPEYFEDQNVLRQLMSEYADLSVTEMLKQANVGAAVLKGMGYGEMDVKAKQKIALASLMARASMAADESGVTGAGRKEWMWKWIEKAPLSARKESELAAKLYLMDYANVPWWLDNGRKIEVSGHDVTPWVNFIRSLTIPFWRYPYNYLKQIKRLGPDAVKTVFDKKATGSEKRQAAANLTSLAMLMTAYWLLTKPWGDDDDEVLGRDIDDAGEEMDPKLRTSSRVRLADSSIAGMAIGTAARMFGADTSQEDLWIRVRTLPYAPQAIALGTALKYITNPNDGGAKQAVSSAWDMVEDFMSVGSGARLGMIGLGWRDDYTRYQEAPFMLSQGAFDLATARVLPPRALRDIATLVDPINRRYTPSAALDYQPGAFEGFLSRIPGATKLLPPSGKVQSNANPTSEKTQAALRELEAMGIADQAYREYLDEKTGKVRAAYIRPEFIYMIPGWKAALRQLGFNAKPVDRAQYQAAMAGVDLNAR